LKANRLSPNSFVYPNQPARQTNTRLKNQNKIHIIIMAPPDKQAAAMMMMLLLLLYYISVNSKCAGKNLTSRRREDCQLHQHTQNPSVFNSFAAI